MDEALSKTAKRKQGDAFEKLAEALISKAGLKIVQTNFNVPGIGEIDIIARATLQSNVSHSRGTTPKFCTVFVEVRSRTSSVYGTALESITPKKQAKLYRTAEQFLRDHPEYAGDEYRFDVIVFDLMDDLVCHEWLTDAF